MSWFLFLTSTYNFLIHSLTVLNDNLFLFLANEISKRREVNAVPVSLFCYI